MNIIIITPSVIGLGAASFETYLQGSLTSPGLAAHRAMARRSTGLRVVVGAIDACIEHNIDSREAIVSAVAKVSLCRRSTIEAVLDALSTGNPDDRRWDYSGGAYRPATLSSAPAILLAA